MTTNTITRRPHVPDFRVADTAPEHPKLRAAGLAAVGLWTTSGAYAMRELTDGFVPEYWVKSWPSGLRHAARLVAVGLWDKETRSGIPGFAFHDWSQYQRPAERFNEERERARERAAKSRRTRAEGAAHAGRTFAEASQAPSPSPSPLPQRGDLGGDRPVLDAGTPRDEPPAPNLDRSSPRCPRHRDVPADDPGPPCRACRDIRVQLEQRPAAPRRDLEARGCSWCDVDGWRIDPANRHHGPLMPGVRCDHTPMHAAAAS